MKNLYVLGAAIIGIAILTIFSFGLVYLHQLTLAHKYLGPNTIALLLVIGFVISIVTAWIDTRDTSQGGGR